MDLDAYLDRIGLADPPRSDLDGLELLQWSHLVAAPFENLDIALGAGVVHGLDTSYDEVVDRRHGGWCFELNGAFSLLLTDIGFDVRLLGCAVLLDGPNDVIDHLALEVSGGVAGIEPHLVDVGFGDSATRPIPLNRSGAHDGGIAAYELLPSPKGTTLARLGADGPHAEYRFKRVAHRFEDFASVAHDLQTDPELMWSKKPFATRLLGSGTDRVTLLADRIKFRRDGAWEERPVADAEWSEELRRWFGLDTPHPTSPA